MTTRVSILATRHVRVLPTTTPFEIGSPTRERSAERRIQPDAARHHSALPPRGGLRAAARTSGRARLPALCCGSRRGFDLPTQLQAMLPGTRVVTGVTRPRLSQSSDSTSRLGRRAEGLDAQSRPGADCIVPRAGTASAPSFEVPSRKAPSASRVALIYHYR
jgi:hypothetical protein